MADTDLIVDTEAQRRFQQENDAKFGFKNKAKPTPSMAPPPTQQELGAQMKQAEVLRQREQRANREAGISTF